jgi:hypothetical protein
MCLFGPITSRNAARSSATWRTVLPQDCSELDMRIVKHSVQLLTEAALTQARCR